MQKRNISKIKRELKDHKALVQCAEEFNMVGDQTRLKICYLLCRHKELPVGEIAEIIGVSISAVSHSLKKLRDNNLVESRREHKAVYYKLADTSFNEVLRNSLTNI